MLCRLSYPGTAPPGGPDEQFSGSAPDPLRVGDPFHQLGSLAAEAGPALVITALARRRELVLQQVLLLP